MACPVKPRGYDLGPCERPASRRQFGAHPERLIGVARVDPLLGDDACHRAGAVLCTELALQGLFLHPWEETSQ